MKKILCVALVSLFCLTAFARGKQPVSFAKMPEVLQTEILKNFTEDQVQLITSEKTMNGLSPAASSTRSSFAL